MKLLGIRFCTVSDNSSELIEFFSKMGLEKMGCDPEADGAETYEGGVFPAGDSWIEVWQSGEGMPAGTMLQLFVDNSAEFAAHAKQNGLDLGEPMDAHGERIYFATAPGGLPISIQSKL